MEPTMSNPKVKREYIRPSVRVGDHHTDPPKCHICLYKLMATCKPTVAAPELCNVKVPR